MVKEQKVYDLQKVLLKKENNTFSYQETTV